MINIRLGYCLAKSFFFEEDKQKTLNVGFCLFGGDSMVY